MKNIIMNAIEKAISEINVDAEIILHPTGEKASGNRKLENFIKSTNQKYYNSNSDILEGDFVEIVIYNDDKESSIRIEMDYLKHMNNIEEVSEYVKHSIEEYGKISEDIKFVIDRMEFYDLIKDRLIIRPLNYSNNKINLEDYVYDTFGDIALVLYAVIDDKESLHTVKIPYDIFKKWNLDKKIVFTAAMDSTKKSAEARIYTDLRSINGDGMDINDNVILESNTILMITTTRKTNGAIAMFYPGVKEKIAEMFDDSFYVAFTSIHEAMIHKKGTIEPSSIRCHIRATNRTFGSEETLTEEVYYYDKDNHSFGMVNL